MTQTPIDSSPLSLLLRRVDAAADGAPAPDTIATGFPSLDKLLGGGMRRGDLVVLGGDVGVGKSALALAIGLRAAAGRSAVAFYSGEMTEERILERALAIEGRARIDDLRRGVIDDATRASIGAAALRLRGELPRIAPIPRGGATAIDVELRSAIDLDLAIVDSLGAIPAIPPAAGATQDEELAAAARHLKRLAIETGTSILVTAHLPGFARGRPDPRPTLGDLGALGAVQQHADVVLGLFREEMYQPALGNEGATELLVLKNRNGTTSYVDLYFYKAWLRFEDMLEPDR